MEEKRDKFYVIMGSKGIVLLINKKDACIENGNLVANNLEMCRMLEKMPVRHVSGNIFAPREKDS